MTEYQWQVRPVAPPEALSAFGTLHRVAGQLLYNRSIYTIEQARSFVNRDGRPWPDPFLLPDMQRAVETVVATARNSQRVVVYGDFDADGITGTALLVLGLRAVGINVEPYIPHREREGYGLNVAALETLQRAGARLIISVDTGTSALEEITHAVGIGLNVIALDHHSIPPQLPPAAAVVNPHRAESAYPFRGLSGVGVAFKFLQALYTTLGKGTEGLEANLDLAAIGTVADISPLYDENRWIVQQGLEVLNRAPRLGLLALMQRAGMELGMLDATDLGFMIAPRLNAMGRLEHAAASYQLLCTEDPNEASALAEQLETTNHARRELTQATLAQARADVAAQRSEAPVLIVGGEGYAAGIIGLVASKLAEEWYRPAVVLEQGPEFSRGSCRSIPGFSIVDALRACSDLFVRFGGHPAAAGFTIATARIPELRERLGAVCATQLTAEHLLPVLSIDAEARPNELQGQPASLIKRLRPYGTDNPEPLFLSRGLRVAGVRGLGATGAHLEVKLGDGDTTWRAMGFGMGDRIAGIGKRLDVVYALSENRWRGNSSLQLRLKAFREGAEGA